MKFQVMAEHQRDYPVTTMCRALEVSESGYYAWRKHEPSQHCREDAELADKICVVFEAAIDACMGAHVSMQNCMHKGFIALGNGSLVSCENGSWWQNVRAIEPSQRKVREEQRSLRTCSNRIFMLISPSRNGRRIRPTFGHKRDGGSLAVVLDLFSRMVARLVNGSYSRCYLGRQCTGNGFDSTPSTSRVTPPL
jgi:hypothetical protein